MRRPNPPPKPRRASRPHGSRLDARAEEAIKHVVNVLARSGCAPRDIQREVHKVCNQVPSSWAHQKPVAPSALDAAAHVLTLWFSDPAYVDARGQPRPLTLQGDERSLEKLAFRVDPGVDAREIVQHLLRQRVLRRVGPAYQPRHRVLMFRSAESPHHVRNLQALVAMLSTLDHNSRARRSTPKRFEEFAVNTHVPVRALKAFERQFRSHANRLLVQSDDLMHFLERRRKKGERTVRFGVGIYVFKEMPAPPAANGRRKKNVRE